MTPEWDKRVKAELEPGEDLVWSAQPLEASAGSVMASAWPMMLFGVFWLGFTWFGYSMWKSHQDFRAKHFSDPFFKKNGADMGDSIPLVIGGVAGLVGVGLLLSPVWILWSRRSARAGRATP